MNLPSLKCADYMFADCESLREFTAETPNLVNGYAMFMNDVSLTSFNGDLSNLTNGVNMFTGCKLDESSVQNIAESIKDVRGSSNTYVVSYSTREKDASVIKTIHIDIPIEYEEMTATYITSFTAIKEKGWTVVVNGVTFDGEETQIGDFELD